MKRIIRLTESDLARIVRRVINEGGEKPKITITQDVPTDVSGLIGYKSAFLKTVTATVYDTSVDIYITINKTLGTKFNIGDPNNLGYGRYKIVIEFKDLPKTREEASALIQKAGGSDTGGTRVVTPREDCLYNECKPYSVPAFGTYTKDGKTYSWGNSGKYLGTELNDVLCKVLGI